MKVTIQHFDGKYPSFNIMVHAVEGADPFITIRGCRIVEGKNGPFVSYPATKNDQGKYWNHVVGGEKFNEYVIKESMKQTKAHKPNKGSGFDNMDSDAPF